MTSSERNDVNRLCTTIMNTIWSESQKHINFLIGLKCHENTDLSLNQLKIIWKECLIFITKSENYFNTKSKTLMNALIAMVKEYLNRLHSNQMNELTEIIKKENWKQVLVNEKYQKIIDKLLEINNNKNFNFDQPV